MKSIIYLILMTLPLLSTELTLNRYQDNNQSIDIYHLTDTKSISCRMEYGDGFDKVIRCKLTQKMRTERSTRKDPYFDIKFTEDEVIFVAKKYIKLLAIDDNLIVNSIVDQKDKYQHWAIIGALKEPQLFKNKSIKEFNYPITYQETLSPYIGALDLNGEPIMKSKGASILGKVRNAYQNGEYANVIKECDNYTKRYDDTFSGDIKLYKIRSLDKLAENEITKYQELQDITFEWIADNASNEHIPEAYMFIAKSFYKLGRLADGDKYLNILKSGFKDDISTQKAQLVFADTIYKNVKRRSEALTIYKDILYATKDLDTATLAAMKIANVYLDFKKPEKAEKIYEKVLKSSQEYLGSNVGASYAIAQRFADEKKYDLAIETAKILLLSGDQRDKESIVKDLAYWYELKASRDNAIMLYQEYLKTYPNGKHVEFVREHLDGLLIHADEQNMTKKLLDLDNLIQKYQGNEIAKKALDRKVEILYDLKEYKQILEMKALLDQNDTRGYVYKSAQELFSRALERDDCPQAIGFKDDYNLTQKTFEDEKLFQCMVQQLRFNEAQTIAQPHIKSKNLQEKMNWLYNIAKVYKRLGKNKKTVLAGTDVMRLSNALGVRKYNDILYTVTAAYYDLREYEGMLKTVQSIEKEFAGDYRNVDLFMKVVRYAQKSKNNMLLLNYAKKVIALQKRYKITAYSPKIEIAYAHGLKKIGQNKQARNEVMKLLTKKLTDAQKAEVLYLAGELSILLKEEEAAKGFFTKCGEIVKDSAWQKLCAENLALLID